MPARIRILPDSVANQIAAGEVVERPASVVKELVENALDAGATIVEVRIQGPGRRHVRVADDGLGMTREDVLLALDRHATSKIESADDLMSVRSFGFRGEALPSIAAVSRLTIETRPDDEAVGTMLRASAGRIVAVEDCPRQRGTTVDVQGLFFNAPARAKFLKAESAESRAILDVMTTLSLAHPGVTFRLHSGGRCVLDLPATTEVGSRAEALWGNDARAFLPLVHADGGLEVRGLVLRPDAAQPGVRRGHFFVNGRPFKDAALTRAVDRGYRTTIPPRARPWFVLYLSVPDGWVDVNVHPAKAEVRFRDGAAVEALLETAVQHALAGSASSAFLGHSAERPKLELRDEGRGTFYLRDHDGGSRSASGGRKVGASPTRGEGLGAPDIRPKPADQMALFVAGGVSAVEGEPPSPEELEAERPRLWQLHHTYIMAETRDGLLIIDQHSAHERVLFERLMSAFGDTGEPSQRLLFPLTLRLTAAEVQRVEELSGMLRAAGFEVEGFGGDTVILQAVPNPHPWFDAQRCFREMVAELTVGSELMRSARNQHERIAKTFACKGAIKAGQKLSETEMQQLFDKLFATKLPYHDVHGRPTIVRLSRGELERKFGRS